MATIAKRKPHFIEKILDRASNTPLIPLAFIGNPGSGKTMVVEDYCQRNNLPLVKLLSSSLDETDVAGIVISTAEKRIMKTADGGLCIRPSEDGGAKTLSPDWVKKLASGGILLLDELNCARREVQDSLLTLVQSRHLPNGDPLHSSVLIVACMNDFVQCNNYSMSPAMRNRFAWFSVVPSVPQWLSWAQERLHPEVFAFFTLAFQRGLVFSPDADFMDESQNLFTTPRSLWNLIQFSGAAQMEIPEAGVKKAIDAIVTYSVNFLPKAAVGVFRTLLREAKKDRSNAVFQNYVKNGMISAEGTEAIAAAVEGAGTEETDVDP
jgi:hypothetical protein